MKIPRFVKEYAKHQLTALTLVNVNINYGIREELKRRINRYIDLAENGYITIDECMRLLSLPDTEEDMSQYMI